MKLSGIYVFLFLFCALSWGCSLLRDSDTKPTSKLPKPKPTPDSVGIEMTFVRIPLNETAVEQSIWAEADEQCIDADVRIHLQSNGFRCGLVNQQLPARLRQLLDESEKDGIATADSIDLLSRTRQQTWRAEKRVLIMATPSLENFVYLRSESDAKLISGRTFAEAQGFFAARAFPQNDGHVRFEITPEVQHGNVKNQFIATEGSIQIQAGRETFVLDDMTIKPVMAPGQTLLLGCTHDRKGLGRTFFVDEQSGEPHQKMLLLRLIQTQKTDLFDSLFDE